MTEAEFLEKYEALCREAGMFISACGCCGSPWPVTIAESTKYEPSDDPIGDHMRHIKPDALDPHQ